MTDTSPASLIADLNASLADAGTPMTLTRSWLDTDNVTVRSNSVTLQGALYERRLQNKELAPGYDQQGYVIVISPTEIAAAGWPVGVPIGKEQSTIPQHNDMLGATGDVRKVDYTRTYIVQGVLVRMEVYVLG